MERRDFLLPEKDGGREDRQFSMRGTDGLRRSFPH